MQIITTKVAFLLLFSAFAISSHSQYEWKLTKDKDGIKIYESETKDSKFKSIKVEYTLQGTYDKLIAVLNDVANHKDWVYKSKVSYMLKKISIHDFYYYTETSIPWPMTNRDAVVHLTMTRDSLDRFLKIKAVSVPDLIPEKIGKVRVLRSMVNWYVTKPSPATISIVYTFEADPGGSMPAWLVNMFADKGPYESFKKLSEILKK